MSRLIPRDYLNDKEVESLEQTLKEARSYRLRDSLLIETGLKTGGRESEIIALTTDSLIKLEDDVGAVFFEGLKGSFDREVVISDDLFHRLKMYASTLKPGSLLFPISDSRVRQIWYEFRPCAKRFHALRHTYAKRLYRISKDIQQVQRDLGHKNLSNTMRYAAVENTASERKRFAV